jgi:hypothetical protein
MADVQLELLRVLRLAEQVCEHHEAHKHEKTNPDYIEVKLLKACKEARRVIKDSEATIVGGFW